MAANVAAQVKEDPPWRSGCSDDQELAVGSARVWILRPRNQHSRSYEIGLSWLTISPNQASSSDRWSGVISVNARPIPNRGSQ